MTNFFLHFLQFCNLISSKVYSEIFRQYQQDLFLVLSRTNLIIRKSIVAAIIFSPLVVSAEDFSRKKFSFGSVAVGSLLECEAPDAAQLKRNSPKMFGWAVSQGLAEASVVTGTASYTEKVTSQYLSDQRALIIGCWVATEIVTEKVNGKAMAFAKGSFKLNDAIRSAPLAELAACKARKPGSPIYVQGDFRVVYEVDPKGCTSDNWQERLSPLTAVERETALFELKLSNDRKGYLRNIAF
jgi:hypothetical protein